MLQDVTALISERLPSQSDILHSIQVIQTSGWGPEAKPNITESIHQEKVSSKTETTGSLTEGSGPEVIPLTGRTSYFYDNWESINASSQVLILLVVMKFLL